MRRNPLVAFALLFVLFSGTSAAEARGRGKAELIPCLGDRIVKMADLPGEADAAGRPVRLGYAFTLCFSGHWVRYSDGSRFFPETLQPEDVAALVRRGTLTAMPSAPIAGLAILLYPGTFYRELLWMLAGCLWCLYLVVFSRLRNLDSGIDFDPAVLGLVPGRDFAKGGGAVREVPSELPPPPDCRPLARKAPHTMSPRPVFGHR